MKSKLLSDLQGISDDPIFSVDANEIGASFISSPQLTSVAATAPSGALAATMPSDAPLGSMPNAIILPLPVGFTSVPITSGGITINLLFDAAAMSAPQSFREGIEQGATLLASAITDKITVNITIDYSGTGKGAGAKPDDVHSLSYSLVREALILFGSANPNTLPATSSIQGLTTSGIQTETNVDVYNAQEKVWGQLGANDTTTDDGEAIFATDIDPTLLAGVALHELTHALGRAPVITNIGADNDPTPDVFDLFRFSSPGVRVFYSYSGFGSIPPPNYFSMDGGNTKLADYDLFSDPSDFKDDGVQGSTDPFDAHYTSDTNQFLTALDLEQMTALGFHMTSAIPATVLDIWGSTRLDRVGLYYYLDGMNAVGGSGPLLKLSGAPVYQGQLVTSFGAWKPIGAEQTATGYEVAWNVPGTDLYSLWNTDSSGNYISNGGNGGIMSGISRDMELAEVGFQQDLNGDGVIGLKTTVIEAIGSTKLDQVANNYFLDPLNGVAGSGALLKSNAAPVISGMFGPMEVLIGAEQTATGYEVAWKIFLTAGDLSNVVYAIWTTDANGNEISSSGALLPTSWSLASAETSFQQDLNGDGIIGVHNIESFGSTRLDLFAGSYLLDPVSGGQGPTLKYQGAAVFPGQFGSLIPIGAEQTASGYEVAWKVVGADQYTVWMTDSNGNYLSTPINAVSGASLSLESAETVFHQDLNGDGLIGPPNVEASGSTRLDQFGSNYVLDPVSGGPGPSLKYQGAAVVVGQFGSWTPIGAEQTAIGYEVAWKVTGADQYQVWNTDSNGNYVSAGSALSGASITLEAAEIGFHQDLNGDGIIGVPATVVEAFGSTKLDLAGSTYSLDPVSGGQGPTLKYQGAAVVPGQFGSWTIIGADHTATGYEVAWKVDGADQYIVWNTDSTGNYVSQGPALSGASIVLEAAETSLHQDLNGDGIIGVPATVVEAFGSTRLDLAGSTYSLDPVSGGQGPTLKYQGAAVVPGQFGSWTVIGAEHTATGYEVAWKVDGADQFIVWNTDSNGNYVSQGSALTGTSFALETAETSFHQDLNGDGTIGVPNIEAFGATRLDLVGNTYSLDPVTGGQGPSLKFSGAPVLPGQFGGLAPIGAEQTGSGGYEIAWKDATGGFSIWNTDNKGNYVSTIVDHVVGSNTSLESQETFFQQDLNGDGVIGVPPTPPSGPDGGPVGVPPASGPAGDSFVFRPDLGTNSVMVSANVTTPDSHTPPPSLLPEFSSSGPAAAFEMLILHVSDPHDPSSSQDHLTSFLHVADLHAGGVLIH